MIEKKNVTFEKENLLPFVKLLAESKSGAVVRVKCLGGGSFGLAFEVEHASGNVKIVKAFKIADMLNAEAEALRLLRQASPLSVPEVFYTHSASEEIPINALCMERIRGVNALSSLRFPFLGRRKRANFAETITDALIKIHGASRDKFGFVGGAEAAEQFDTWQEFYKKLANDTFEKAKGFCSVGWLDKAIFSLLEIGMEKFDYIFADKVEKASLLHGDLNVLNIMVDKKTFAPTGIIDPFNSMWGDREYDLFQLNAITGQRYKLYDTYKRKSKCSERVDLKCAFYALVNECLCHMKSGHCPPFAYSGISKRLTEQYQKHGIKQ